MGKVAACKPIFVLGVDRSGTSMVSELVHRWGAYVGDMSLHGEANDGNPRGYFEYQPMQELLGDVSASTALSEWSPDFSAMIRRRASEPLYRNRALELVAKMESAGRPWLWKEPFLSLHMDFWERVVGHPVCVATVRNPHDSARSFAKMFLVDKMGRRARLTSYFCMRWQRFQLAILEYFERNPASLYVCYEELLRSPNEQVERLCIFLDRQLGLTEGREERLAAMLETITPGLWRNRSDASFFDLPEALDSQKALLRHLHLRAADVLEPFDPAAYALPPYAQEYLENFDLFLSYPQEAEERSEREKRRRRPRTQEVA